jgi:hypothetical protein
VTQPSSIRSPSLDNNSSVTEGGLNFSKGFLNLHTSSKITIHKTHLENNTKKRRKTNIEKKKLGFA